MVKAALSATARPEQKAEPTDGEIAARLETLDGSRWLVWYRLRKADPSVSLAFVAEHMPDMTARNAAFARLAEIDKLELIDPKKA